MLRICLLLCGALFVLSLMVSRASAQAMTVEGSVVEDGGFGKPAGLELSGAGEAGARTVRLVQAPSSVVASEGEAIFPTEATQNLSIDARWTWRTNAGDGALDLRWGRFVLPTRAGSSIDLSGGTYLLIVARRADDQGKLPLFSVALRDAAKAEGRRLAVAAYNLAPITDEHVTFAIPLGDIAGQIDVSRVASIVIEASGEVTPDVLTGWYIDRIAVSSEKSMPGLGRTGSVHLGDKVAVTWEPRNNADVVRLILDGRVISEAPADAGQMVIEASRVASGEVISLQPAAGDRKGPLVPLTIAAPQQAAEVTLTYAGPARETAISRWLLGTNGQQIETAAGQGVSVVRWGGNHTSTYNWKDDTTNSANDWYHMTGTHGDKPWEKVEDSRWYKYIKRVRDDGIDVNLHIPISDWVSRRPKDGEPGGSYPRSLYPEQQKFSGDGKYGNGRTPDGKYIRMTDKSLTFRPNSVAFQREWIKTIVKTFGSADEGGVRFYGLDNEVNLWHSSHFGANPEGIDGPELVWRNIAYARMIKEEDPTAMVLGFGGWGQMGVAGSDRDYRRGRWSFLPKELGDLERSELRGGQDLLTWYLDEMREAELRHGRRLIDVVSINWYPFLSYVDPTTGKTKSLTDEKGATDQGYDPFVTPLQFDSLRYWWDPTYVNEASWTFQGTNRAKFWDPYTPVIPKLHAIIAKHYPGTKLAITEYMLGSEETMTGALLQVMSIGIFAENDLFSAQRWFGTRSSTWAYWGYALVGNWDGQRSGIQGHFRKVLSDSKQVIAWSTETKETGRRHVVLVNQHYEKSFSINLPAEDSRRVRVSYLSESTGKQVVRLPAETISGSTVTITLPAFSAAVCVFDR